MNHFFSQFKKDASEIRLTTAERARMRALLEQRIAEGGLVKSPIQFALSPLLVLPRMLVPALALVLIVGVGVGTSYAAEGALPGDLLYTVKLNVNERVVEALAMSLEARADWHAKAAERRMKEAEVLAERGGLSEDARETLEANFERHAERIAAVIADMEIKDPVTAAHVSARLESSIEAHSAVIARLGSEGRDEGSRRASGSLSQSLRDSAKRLARAERPTVAAERKASGEIEVSMMLDVSAVAAPAPAPSPADDALTARIEATASTTLQEAEVLLFSLKSRLDATTSARTEAQISHIRKLIQRIKTGMQKGESQKENVQQALNDAKKLKAFLEAQGQFEEHMLLPAPGVEENGEEGRSGENDDSTPALSPVPVPLPL